MSRTLRICGLLAAMLFVASPCLGKSYRIEAMKIDAVVSTDGSMHVTENVTYSFVGSFTYAYRDIPLKVGEELTDARVTEGGREFTLSEGGAPWTFSVSRTRDAVRITWRYSAEDEMRTFGISYTMRGVVKRYPDIAEIYYKFVGEGWDRPVGGVDVEVRLPDIDDSSGVRAWAHGPLHGTVAVSDRGTVLLSVSPLPARTFWEGRIVCPGDAFGGVTLASNEPRLKAILDEEAAWAEEANRVRGEWRKRAEAAAEDRALRARRAERLLPLSILLGLGGLGVWGWLFTRHGRPHRVVSHFAPGEVPSDHSPAVVSYLMNRTVSGPAVAATLIDMAERGYLEIHESVAETKGLFGKRKRRMEYRFDVVAKPLSDLRPYERELLEFVLNEAGDSSGFSVSAIEKAASRKRSAFLRFFRKWNKDVAAHSESYGFYEPYPVPAMVSNALCGVAILASGVAMSVFSEVQVGMPAIAGGFLQGVFTVALTRRTAEGRRLMLAWKAFRSHLKSVGRGLGPVSLDSSSWGRYVVAAVLFGLHEKLLPNLRLEEGMGAVVYPAWFHGSGGTGIGGLASGLSAMASTVSSAASSAAGAGGGASGGGGGGSGGGGGGAG